MRSYAVLIQQILAWGSKHGIICEEANPTLQLAVVVEELGELASNIYDGSHNSEGLPLDLLKDDVGDVTFSTIVLMGTLGRHPEQVKALVKTAEELAYNRIQSGRIDDVGFLMLQAQSHLGNLARALIKGGNVDNAVAHLLSKIYLIAGQLELTVIDCLEQVYDVVNARKGDFNANGVWTKS